MKKHILHIIVWVLSLIAPSALRAGVVDGRHTCGYVLTQNGATAYLTIETVHGGDVHVYLEDGPGATHAVFRGGNGMGDISVWQVKSGSTTSPASTYFTKDYAGDGAKEMYLRKKAGVSVPQGATIYFMGTIEWKCDEQGNQWKSNQPLSHQYGTVCGTLDAPEITSWTDEGVITFTTVSSADYYTVQVYRGAECMYSEVIVSSGTVDFHSYLDCTYDVCVQAHSNGGDYSAESEPVQWTLEANLSYLPASTLCAEPFGDKGGELTWETDMDGNVVISISGEVGTHFRGNGMGATLADFTVDGQPASNWFDRVYQGGVTYILQLRDPANHPTYGATIRYRGNAHYLEYATPQDGNAYAKFSFDYIYGTTCPKLQAPTDVAVSAEGVITFSDVPYAEQYEVTIYRGELIVGTYSLQSGDEIPYTPYVSYPYTIYVRALAEGMVPSAQSEPYIWLVNGVEGEPEMSTMCEKQISTADGGIHLTVETMANGDIRLRLSGSQNPVWRAEGIKTSAMMICGYPVDDYFDKQSKAEYEGNNTMLLRLKRSAQGVFCTGDKVVYNAQHVEWYVNYVAGATNNTQGYVLTYSFDYTYGSACTPIAERLATPEVVQLEEDGHMEITPVTGAAGYEAAVYDGDGDEVWHQVVSTTDSLGRGESVLAGFEYCVRVRALSADEEVARHSLWSDCTAWEPGERTEDSEQGTGDSEQGTGDENENENVNENGSVTPTVPEVEEDDHKWPDPIVPPVVVDTLADQTDTVPPILPRDTIQGSLVPDTIEVTVVDSLAGETDPIPPTPEAVEEVGAEDPRRVRKVMINGEVFILVDERRYTIMGELVE